MDGVPHFAFRTFCLTLLGGLAGCGLLNGFRENLAAPAIALASGQRNPWVDDTVRFLVTLPKREEFGHADFLEVFDAAECQGNIVATVTEGLEAETVEASVGGRSLGKLTYSARIRRHAGAALCSSQSPTVSQRSAVYERVTGVITASADDAVSMDESSQVLVRPLGVAIYGDASFPSNIETPGTFASLSLGYQFTCGITSAGELKCWGANEAGQIGDGSLTGRLVPTSVGSGYESVDLGTSHGCAIKTNGDLYCWGLNDYGQVGDGSQTNRSLPTLIGSGYASVSVAAFHTCAVTTGGQLECWGRNDVGALGDGSYVDRHVPTLVGAGYASVSAGSYHTCAITTGQQLRCWGSNGNGQVGDNSTTQRNAPVVVGAGYASVNLGNSHSCALTTGGDLRCWGYNAFGQVYNGTTTSRRTPGLVGSGYASISSGAHHSCARKNDGRLFCWGVNGFGQVGDGTTTSHATPVEILPSIDFIDTGYYHNCVLSGGKPKCWGGNGAGRLGDASTIDRYYPPKDPNSGSCVVLATSSNLYGATCTCDGFVCALQVSARTYTSPKGWVTYTVRDGSGNYTASGALTVSIRDIP